MDLRIVRSNLIVHCLKNLAVLFFTLFVPLLHLSALQLIAVTTLCSQLKELCQCHSLLCVHASRTRYKECGDLLSKRSTAILVVKNVTGYF